MTDLRWRARRASGFRWLRGSGSRWLGWSRAVGLSLAVATCGGRPVTAPPPAAVGVGSRPLAVAGRLEPTALRARAAGAGPLMVLATGAGTSGDHVAAQLNVPAGRCVLLLARASDSIEDIDLFAFGDDGAQFGSDEAADDEPTLLVCPEEGTRLYVSARVAAGQGLVAVGAQEVPAASAEQVAEAAGVRNFGRPDAAAAEVWPGLNEALAVHRRRMGGAWEDQRRVAVPVDARVPTRLTARVEAESCLDLLVLATDEVAQLDVEVLDEHGRIFGRSQGGLPRVLLVCSAEAARVTFQLRPHQGRGLAVVALSTPRRGTTAEIEPEFPRAVLLPSRTESRAGAPFEPPKRGSRLEGKARTAGRESLDVSWPGGCGRLDVWSSGDLLGLDTHLWSPGGQLIASGEGLAEVPLFACAPRSKLRLDVEATRRQGHFWVELSVDRDPTSPALSAHPLAASRLLERLHRAGLLEKPSRAGEVRAFDLAETQLTRLPLVVPVQRCLEVYLAVGPGVSGAELRLVEAESGQEVEIARGSRTAAARACGSVASAEVIAELRAVGGSGVGLVATRLLNAAAQADLPSTR